MIFTGTELEMSQKEVKNFRVHNVTTSERTTMGLSLNTNHKGIHVWDTDEDLGYFWNGTQWVTFSGVPQYTDAQAQAAVGAILLDTPSIDFTYAANQISAVVVTQMSVAKDNGGVKLVNDVDTPGNSKYYGTNGSGTRGWFNLPSGGSSYIFQHSVVDNAGTVNLVNDAASPGNKQYYGTNGSGTKGWFALPNSGKEFSFPQSVAEATGVVTLVNDSATPGNSKYYGTNGSGTKGWFALSTGGQAPLTFQHSITNVANVVNFVNDTATPGNSKYYGTNGSGLRGWFDLTAVPLTFNSGLTRTGDTVTLGGTLLAACNISGNQTFYIAVREARFMEDMGANVNYQPDLALGNDGNLFRVVAGPGSVEAIETTNWQKGARIGLISYATDITWKHNSTSGGIQTSPMILSGGVDFESVSGDYISLHFDGNNWNEIGRKLASSVGPYRFTNAITEMANGTVKLGGTLIENTVINGASSYYFRITGGRLQMDKGADVASAGDLVLGNDGNSFTITGTETVNAIAIANWQKGSVVHLLFPNVMIVNHNTAGGAGTAPILLAGAANFSTKQKTILSLLYNGTEWEEINRKLGDSTGVGPYTFTNGLTESPVGIAKLGGALTENTTITEGTNNLTFLSSNITGVTTSSSLVLTANSLTSGSGLYASSTSLSSGALIDIFVNSTAAASNLHRGLNVLVTGANSNSGQFTYGIRSENTHSGSGSLNYGIYGIASGASTNYGIWGDGGSAGVFGNTTAGKGVFGQANNANGIGVHGINIASSGTGYGVQGITTGAKTTGIAGYFSATGATNNYAIIVPTASGNVGIGTSTPTATELHIASINVTGTTTASSLILIANSLTSGSGVYISSTSLSSGALIDVSVNSTAATGNSQKGINVSLSGTNANATQSTYAIYGTNIHSHATATNYGVYGAASGGIANYGVFGSATTIGVYGTSTSGTGVYGQSTNSVGGQFQSAGTTAIVAESILSSTNTIVNVLSVRRQTSGTAADGIGGDINYYIEAGDGNQYISNEIKSKWLVSAVGTRTSQLIITGVNSGTTGDLAVIEANGDWKFTGGIKTGNPSGGTAQIIKFGSLVAATVLFDDSQYIEAEVNGVPCLIAIAALP